MGQKLATLVLVVDRKQASAGDVLRGVIYLDVRSDDLDGESLVLRLIGEEETNIEGQRQIIQATNIFVEKNFVILKQDQARTLTRGQYEFHFEIKLPFLLYSPMELSYFDSVNRKQFVHCGIHYHLEARLLRKSILNSSITHRVPVQLFPSPCLFESMYPSYTIPVHLKLHFFDCFPVGLITLGLYLPSAILSPGEEFLLSYFICNHSSVAIVQVSFSVIEEIIWAANSRTIRSRQICLFQKDLSGPDISFVDMPPFQTSHRSAEIADEPSLSLIKYSLDSLQSAVTLKVSVKARPSLTAKLIATRHFVNCKVKTAFGTNDPEISLPIFVSPPSVVAPDAEGTIAIPDYAVLDDATTIALPADWAPVIADPIVLESNAAASAVASVATATITPASYPDNTPSAVEPPQTSNPIVSTSQALPVDPIVLPDHNPLEVLAAWLRHHSANGLGVVEIQSLFQLLPAVTDQLRIVDLLVSNRESFTCDLIAAVLDSCERNLVVRCEILRKMWSKCVDKEVNRKSIEARLHPFELLLFRDCGEPDT